MRDAVDIRSQMSGTCSWPSNQQRQRQQLLFAVVACPSSTFPYPSLSVTHGAAWHSLTCCLNESDIMWHTFSTASPVIAFVCRAAYDGYCLPPAFCHLQAATGQHRPPAASSCHRLLNYSWCQLQMSFSAVAAWKSGRALPYATAKCSFNNHQKKIKQ